MTDRNEHLNSHKGRSVQTYRGKLQEFFPARHPYTSWMLRLAIIRDDLAFELRQLVSFQPTSEGIWEAGYFLRRLSSTISEAKNIFANKSDVPSVRHSLPPELVPKFDKVIKGIDANLERALPLLEQVRSSVGVHIRPNHSKAPVPAEHQTVEQAVEASRGESFEATVTFGKQSADTDLRELTAAALFYAWPDAANPGAFDARFADYFQKTRTCADDLMTAIDSLLYSYWVDLGVIPDHHSERPG